jgi:hypothetical protein
MGERATVRLTLGGPLRRATHAAVCEVRIGPRGVYVFRHYLPLQGPETRLEAAALKQDPAVLRFNVRTGNRVDEVRVPMPREHLLEAQALV